MNAGKLRLRNLLKTSQHIIWVPNGRPCFDCRDLTLAQVTTIASGIRPSFRDISMWDLSQEGGLT
jgi:hypothetical protein